MNEPFRLIITGDWHFRGSNPRSRLDDYKEALMAKLDDVFELAMKHQASGIIVPGDVFDSPNISIQGISELARKLNEYPVRVYAVPGNHDAFSHNLASLGRTPYGLLRDLEFITCVDAADREAPNSKRFYMQMRLDGPNINLTGHGFDTETDNDIMQYTAENNLPGSVHIHVSHGMLLDHEPPAGMRHTLISDLAKIPEERRPHVLVNGHYHLGLPLTRIGKTLVINPGALTRLTAHVEEMKRPVQVALLTINSTTDYTAEFIPLQSARPGHEVLSREHIEEDRARSARMGEFMRLLAEGGEAKYLEVSEIIDDIARREAIPAAVKSETMRRIGEARELLAAGK